MNGTKSPAERGNDKARRALRIEFAKAALTGLLSFMDDGNGPYIPVAEEAFSHADKMLAELDRREKEEGK